MMNKPNKQQWKEKKPFFPRTPEFDFGKEELNPKLIGKRSPHRVPVKDLPFHLRHARGIQFAVLGVSALIFFSKPIYDTYRYYTGQMPMKRKDIQLHSNSEK